MTLETPMPLGLVWHWTAGKCVAPGYATALAEEIRTYDKTRDRPVSWHVLIAKDGRMFQSVPFNQGSWHVGRPGRIGGAPQKTNGFWNAATFPEGKLFGNINRATIGVELENAGRLEVVDGKFYCWPYWTNPTAPAGARTPDPTLELPESRAQMMAGTWYDTFPAPQEQAAQRLVQALAIKYKWSRSVTQYGHLMFDPGRKEDPGPLWLELALPRILDGVFGKE